MIEDGRVMLSCEMNDKIPRYSKVMDVIISEKKKRHRGFAELTWILDEFSHEESNAVVETLESMRDDGYLTEKVDSNSRQGRVMYFENKGKNISYSPEPSMLPPTSPEILCTKSATSPKSSANLLENRWVHEEDELDLNYSQSNFVNDKFNPFDSTPDTNEHFRSHILSEIEAIKETLGQTGLETIRRDSSIASYESQLKCLTVENKSLCNELSSRDEIIRLLHKDITNLEHKISKPHATHIEANSGWSIVNRPSKHSTPPTRKIPETVQESNRFSNLRCEQVDCISKADEDEVDDVIGLECNGVNGNGASNSLNNSPRHRQQPPPPTTNPRPSIVTNPYPERQHDLRVVPGDALYSEAHKKKVMLVSDSMSGGIKRTALIDELHRSNIDVDIAIHRHAGAQTHELNHYTKLHVADENPHGAIIIGGTNDLPKRAGRRQLTDEEIANNLISTGEYAASQGVTKVFISGIIFRRGAYYNNRRRNINNILRDNCLEHGFIYIDNDNILESHTDGLHLLDEGTNILINNIIKALF